MTPTIAVLIPCLNEAAAIGKVVSDFRAALPTATIYVYDNASIDDTAQVARAAGAQVRHEPTPGKGQVVRRMFADVDADVYVLVDGDDTYNAADAPALVAALCDGGLDMVNGARRSDERASYRPGHRFGNRFLTGLVQTAFGRQFDDMLSGYRVFSRRFVKSFPALAQGFEIETELTIHALELRLPCRELPTAYRARPAGSASKLHTVRDGVRILSTIVRLLKHERPLPFFTAVAAALLLAAVALGTPLVVTYLDTGLVPRLPTAVLVMGLILLAALAFVAGLVLDTVTQGRLEMRRLFYLQVANAEAAARLAQRRP